MPAPKSFRPVETPGLAWKEGIKSEPVARKISVTAPTSVAVPVPAQAPVPVQAKERFKYDRKELALDTKAITGRMIRYLQEGDRLERMLDETKLRDILVGVGIMTDKMLLLEGQPTQIIGQPQQQKLDQLGQALQTMMQQRGLGKTVTLTERTAKIELEQPK